VWAVTATPTIGSSSQMAESVSKDVSTTRKSTSFTFGLADLFIVVSAIGLFLAISVTHGFGLGILVGMFAFSVLALVRRKSVTTKSTKRVYSSIAVIAALGIVCNLAKLPVALVMFEDKHYYFRDGGYMEINGMAVHPKIVGERSFFCLPPLIAGWSERSPYRAGVKIVDYDNKNQCKSVTLTSLNLSCNGKTHLVLADGNQVTSNFSTYINGVSHVSSECLADVGDWLPTNNQSPVKVHATLTIHTSQGKIDDELVMILKPSHAEHMGLFLNLFVR
jgi:hypothetical protein